MLCLGWVDGGAGMTENEAIEELQRIRPYVEIVPQRAEALDVAIKALEKQIPRQPIPIDYEKYIDVIDNARFLRGAYWCPNCKHVVKSGSFCKDCGQKLDWSDVE